MPINAVTPSFTSKNIIISSKQGKNIENPLIFNKIIDTMRDFKTTVIYKTGEGIIHIPEASSEVIAKLLTSDIELLEKNGEKLSKII